MNIDDNEDKNQLILEARNINTFIEGFDDCIDQAFGSYLSHLCMVSTYTYCEIADKGVLYAELSENIKELKKLCETFSKFKRIINYVFIPCKDQQDYATIDENIEFIFNYEENEKFINKEMLHTYAEKFEKNDKLVVVVNEIISYAFQEDYENLLEEINEINKMSNDKNTDILELKRKLEIVKKNVNTLNIDNHYDILIAHCNAVVDKNETLTKNYYHKYIMRKQVTSQYNGTKVDRELCAVCLDNFKIGKSVTKLKCGHVFCTECIEKWLASSITCPCCRKHPGYSSEV